MDDDHHRMLRGQRYAVCDKTYQLYKKAPYRDMFQFIDPRVEIPLAQAEPYRCESMALRHPKQTKGQDYIATSEASQCCDSGGGSCC